MPSEIVRQELDAARKSGEQLEAIAIGKLYPRSDRNLLLLAYWDLVSDFHRGIHAMLTSEFHASAFALVRPVVESLVRAHVAIRGTDDDVALLLNDKYRVNLETIGPWIDQVFGLNGMMARFLNERTRKALHGYTHVGLHQLGRRFDQGYVGKTQYSDGEIVEVIRVTTSAFFMLSLLLTKHFGFDDEWEKVGELFAEWGKH